MPTWSIFCLPGHIHSYGYNKIIYAVQHVGLELFMPGSSNSYIVTAVYYTDTSDMVMRSKLKKIRKSSTIVIILHHYDLDEVLHIFKMVKLSCSYIDRI